MVPIGVSWSLIAPVRLKTLPLLTSSLACDPDRSRPVRRLDLERLAKLNQILRIEEELGKLKTFKCSRKALIVYR